MGKTNFRRVLAGWPFRVTGRCRKWRQKRALRRKVSEIRKNFWLVLDRVTFLEDRSISKKWSELKWTRFEKISFFTKSNWSTMFEQLRRRDNTCLERRSDDDALRSTSLVDRDVTTAMRSTLEQPHQVKCYYSETNSHGKSPLRQCSAFRTLPNVWRHDNLKNTQIREKSLIWTDFEPLPIKLRKHFSFCYFRLCPNVRPWVERNIPGSYTYAPSLNISLAVWGK